jgi:undecaprenyl-diphosphatase
MNKHGREGPRRLPPTVRERIAAFDQRIDKEFDRLRGHPAADRLFYGASAVGDHSLIWLVLCAARALRGDEERSYALRTAAVLGIESALVNGVIKTLVGRRRPPESGTRRPLPLRTPRTSSFPSGHATSAFCAATLLAADDPLGPVYFGAAAVVAWSRVYVRIHHASDVLGGMVIGLALGQVGRRLVPIPRHSESRRAHRSWKSR